VPQDMTAAYATALRSLHKAAGSPTGATIRRLARAQQPPLTVTESSWSDWVNGKNVPSRKEVARFLIFYLRDCAKQKTPTYAAPPDTWWEEMRLRALVERRSGSVRGGRPRQEQSPARPRVMPNRCRIGVIPREADCFQERAVGVWLLEALGTGSTTRAHVLTGMGGVGKTQLAAAYARAAWANGVQVLVWVTASSRLAIRDAYAYAAVQLNLADWQDTELAAEAFLIWADRTDQSWLVVLDDVQDLADLRGLWPPAPPAGRVVVTTRRRDSAFARRGQEMVEVELFTSNEALAFLNAKLGHLAHDAEQSRALAADLGHLPLALAQAAAFMLDRKMDCASYRRLLGQRLLEHIVPDSSGLPDDHHQILAATWNLTVDQADQARPARLARPLLELVSVLDPNGIPEVVLTSTPARQYLAGHIAGSFHLPPQQAADVEKVAEGLWILHKFNLIDYDTSAEHRQVKVHQLIQRATRDPISREPTRYAALTSAAAAALLAVWSNKTHDQLSLLHINTATFWRTTGIALWDREDGSKVWREDDVPNFIRALNRSMGVTVRRSGAFVSERLGQGCGSAEYWNGGGYYGEIFLCGTTYPSGRTFYCSAECFYTLSHDSALEQGHDGSGATPEPPEEIRSSRTGQ